MLVLGLTVLVLVVSGATVCPCDEAALMPHSLSTCVPAGLCAAGCLCSRPAPAAAALQQQSPPGEATAVDRNRQLAQGVLAHTHTHTHSVKPALSCVMQICLTPRPLHPLPVPLLALQRGSPQPPEGREREKGLFRGQLFVQRDEEGQGQQQQQLGSQGGPNGGALAPAAAAAPTRLRGPGWVWGQRWRQDWGLWPPLWCSSSSWWPFWLPHGC